MSDARKAIRISTMSGAGSNACLSCRKVKMKCRIDPDEDKCQRCTRKSFECVFRQHRRGRRPTLKVQSESAMTSRGEATTSSSRTGTLASNQTGFWESSETFRPPDVLNTQAMKGQFSLQNILSTAPGVVAPSRPSSAARSRDPIQVGLVNYHIALSLFNGFMENLNPYICQLDPVLHTFTYVQEKSSFLLTTVLTVAAKILNPSTYPGLKDHAETLFCEGFRRGDKSPEVVQAILILTYWKELDDTRAWSNVGYAIRLSMDLGWHNLSTEDDQHFNTMSSVDQRKRRNVERTWLVLFVYDRSISLQTGKPRMIERSGFLESVDIWYRSPWALASDVLLCAFVSLRLLTSEVLELLESQRTTSPRSQTHQLESLLKIIEKQVEAWQEHWLQIAEDVGCEACNKLLIQFYGIHLRLLLSSFSLKPPLTLPSTAAAMRTAAILTSHASAIEMLSLVSAPDVSPLLYFAQDSVHVMVAYAAVFLVKLLLCVPKEMRSELEGHTIDTIQATAQSFAQHTAPVKSSCWLQAKFLSNVLREFKEASRTRQAHPANMPGDTRQPQEARMAMGHRSVHEARNTAAPMDMDTTSHPGFRPQEDSRAPPGDISAQHRGPYPPAPPPPAVAGPPPATELEYLQHAQPFHTTTSTTSATSTTTTPILDSAPTSAPYPPPAHHTHQQSNLHGQQQQDFTFSDDAMWEAMFANAGFNITDGTFLLDAYDDYRVRDGVGEVSSAI